MECITASMLSNGMKNTLMMYVCYVIIFEKWREREREREKYMYMKIFSTYRWNFVDKISWYIRHAGTSNTTIQLKPQL